MDRESPDLIEREMEQTRASLTQKVAALENQVLGTIQNATETVNTVVETVRTVVPETLTGVKDTVNETVSTVKDQMMSTFDVSQHTRDRPWMMVGGAATLGFVTGLIAFRAASSGESSLRSATSGWAEPRTMAGPAPVAAAPRMPGWLDELLAPLMSRAGEEVRKIGEVALASLSQTVKEMVEQGIPRMVNSTETSSHPNGMNRQNL